MRTRLYLGRDSPPSACLPLLAFCQSQQALPVTQPASRRAPMEGPIPPVVGGLCSQLTHTQGDRPRAV